MKNNLIEILKIKWKRNYHSKFGNKDQSLMLAFKQARIEKENAQKRTTQ